MIYDNKSLVFTEAAKNLITTCQSPADLLLLINEVDCWLRDSDNSRIAGPRSDFQFINNLLAKLVLSKWLAGGRKAAVSGVAAGLRQLFYSLERNEFKGYAAALVKLFRYKAKEINYSETEAQKLSKSIAVFQQISKLFAGEYRKNKGQAYGLPYCEIA